MIRVHHLEHSRSQRVLWLLEELGVDYRVVVYQRDAETWLAPASLEASSWFAGEAFSAADIQMSFPVLALEGRGGLEAAPRLRDFLTRCRERPAYRRAVERGGEFSLSGGD